MQFQGANAVEEVKNRLDIGEVIGRYVQLKRAGVNLRGLCPFHGEKTPSFYVTPSRQIWHCFGCSEGGDVISFIQKIEHLEFRETLEMLAEQAGVELPSFNPKQLEQKSEAELLLKINKFAAQIYARILFSSEGKAALDYLTGRGLKEETIKEWQIGFCPLNGQDLLKAISKHGVSVPGLVRAGIYAQGERGFTYDRFRGRITFPILNLRGQVVGFSARILDAESQFAKYVNSAESLVYRKSEILFGAFQAKETSAKLGQVVVVEGQMDCISSSQAEIPNVVATSGTAFTLSHGKIIKRLAQIAVLCFDSDKAGQNALKKTVQLLMSSGIEVKIVNLVGEKDPDELIKKAPALWVGAVADSVPAIEYYCGQGKKIQDELEQRKWVTEEIAPLLRLTVDPLEKELWMKRVASVFGIAVAAIEKLAGSTAFGGTGQEQREGETTAVSITESQGRHLELQVLGGVLRFPEITALAKEIEITQNDFVDPGIREAAGQILGESPNKSLDTALTREASFVVESINNSLGEDSASLQTILAKSCYRLRLNAINILLVDVTNELRGLQSSANDLSFSSGLQKKAKELAERRVFLEQKLTSL